MNFTLSEEQEMLRTSARDFLTENCPRPYVKQMETDEKGYSAELWRKMVELGWLGLALPELYGGGGMEFINLAVLLEEMGRVCLPGPFFTSVVLGAMTILADGNEKQKAEYLPAIASGKTIITMALCDADGSHKAGSLAATAFAEKNDFIINGMKLFVPDAHIADHIILPARTSDEKDERQGITVFIVPAKGSGVTCTSLKTISGAKLCQVVFDNVRVSHDSVMGAAGKGWPIIEKTLERAAAAICCETVGVLQRVQEMTLDYTKERKQFDKQIGAFQVIQQYMADIVTDTDGARFTAYQAAWKMSEGLPATKETAIAKVWSAEAYERTIARAHQIFGAIGTTIDHDLHFYTTRGKANQLSYGDADFWREQVAKAMGL